MDIADLRRWLSKDQTDIRDDVRVTFDNRGN
jgi:hypothetical protein